MLVAPTKDIEIILFLNMQVAVCGTYQVTWLHG
jgi:hypothetical protein